MGADDVEPGVDVVVVERMELDCWSIDSDTTEPPDPTDDADAVRLLAAGAIDAADQRDRSGRLGMWPAERWCRGVAEEPPPVVAFVD